jgi:hypothetical protein
LLGTGGLDAESMQPSPIIMMLPICEHDEKRSCIVRNGFFFLEGSKKWFMAFNNL